jgi:hypothetical protein
MISQTTSTKKDEAATHTMENQWEIISIEISSLKINHLMLGACGHQLNWVVPQWYYKAIAVVSQRLIAGLISRYRTLQATFSWCLVANLEGVGLSGAKGGLRGAGALASRLEWRGTTDGVLL